MAACKPCGKTTAMTENAEYKAFLSLRIKTIPLLREKILAADGFDFALCDVVIDQKGWLQQDGFGDYGKRFRKVLKELDGGSGEQ